MSLGEKNWPNIKINISVVFLFLGIGFLLRDKDFITYLQLPHFLLIYFYLLLVI